MEAFEGVNEDEEEAKALLKGPDDSQVEDVKKLLKIKGEKSSDSTKEEGPKITELLD